MKAKVIKRFRDKHTNEIYDIDSNSNSIYESNEKRIKELQGLGFLGEEVKEKNEQSKKEQEKPKQEQPKQKQKKTDKTSK